MDNRSAYYLAAKGDGTNAFATTYAEHLQNIETYLVPLQNEIEG